MKESIKPKSLPPLRMSELQDQLKQSYNQHRQDVMHSYREIKTKRQKEIADINKYKSLERKVFNSQNKQNGQQFEKERDIYLCKEPLIDDFVKCHIIDPQRNLEKGLKEFKTGKKQLLDGRCFDEVPECKLNEKEKQYRQYWQTENEKLAQIRYQCLLDSQTGLKKKINQSQRLESLKVFIPNNFAPSLFNEHPSQILNLIESHQHAETKKWSPNRFYGDFLDKSCLSNQSLTSKVRISDKQLKK